MYGPLFRNLDALWCGKREALGRIDVPAALSDPPDVYHVHPAILDACLHTFLGTVLDDLGSQDGGGLVLPVRIRRVQIHQALQGTSLWSCAWVTARSDAGFEGDVYVLNEDGTLAIEIIGFACDWRPNRPAVPHRPPRLYEMAWYAKALPSDWTTGTADDLPGPRAIEGDLVGLPEQHVRAGRRRHEIQVGAARGPHDVIVVTCHGNVPDKLAGTTWHTGHPTQMDLYPFPVMNLMRRFVGRMEDVIQQDDVLVAAFHVLHQRRV